MKLTRATLIVFSLAALVGCASSNPQHTKYYNFNNTSTQIEANQSTNKTHKRVILQPLQLATFLNQQGLVIQLDEHQVYTSTYHRWAQPLQEILFNTLTQELNNTSSTNYSFAKENPLSNKNTDFQLHIDVEQFNSTNKSQVVFSGHFWVYNTTTTLMIHQPFLLSEELTEDGYQHSVKKLQLTITQLAKKINASLNTD